MTSCFKTEFISFLTRRRAGWGMPPSFRSLRRFAALSRRSASYAAPSESRAGEHPGRMLPDELQRELNVEGLAWTDARGDDGCAIRAANQAEPAAAANASV